MMRCSVLSVVYTFPTKPHYTDIYCVS